MNKEKTRIEFEGIKYFEVGCRKCYKSEWKIYYNELDFIAKCQNCEHVIILKKASIMNSPDEPIIKLYQI